MQTFKFFCSFHLGDQMFLLWFLNVAAKRWPNIQFSFRVPTEYLDELKRLARKTPNLEITDKDDGHCLEGWMGTDGWYGKFNKRAENFVDFQLQFHAYLAKKYGLPSWEVPDRKELLFPAECMDPNHDLSGRSFDVLFVNSQAMSGQCREFNESHLNSLAIHVSKRCRVVTTHPSGDPDVPSTRSFGLRLSQVGELASRCKIVAGVVNAPFLATFNELAFPNIERWVNYSCDKVNFDDSRVTWCQTQSDLEKVVKDIYP